MQPNDELFPTISKESLEMVGVAALRGSSGEARIAGSDVVRLTHLATHHCTVVKKNGFFLKAKNKNWLEKNCHFPKPRKKLVF